MIHLLLVGIGTGNPDHLTLQAIRALNSADLILLPRKGHDKADLADLRRAICTVVLTSAVPVAEFDLPRRDEATPDYLRRVEDWHDAIAEVWAATIAAHPLARRVALMVWGDPSLYDSTLRIAGRLRPLPEITVIPGLTSIQLLTAAHGIPLNAVGEPVMVTTGRRLRAEGWPPGTDTLVVMLDGDCAFRDLPPGDLHLWWGAYVGLPDQVLIAGPLAEVSACVVETRSALRERIGWIMDIYILRRGTGA